MARSLVASVATVLCFLAFGFELIGVVSVPATRVISLASYGSTKYGVWGWCPTNSKDSCSKVGVGYSLHDTGHWYLSSSGQQTLAKILIAHVVAAGCLFVSLILVGATHVNNRSYRLAVAIIFVPVFLLTLLVFIVEILLFGTDLNFAGWFSLPAMVLSAAVLGLLFGNIRLSSSLSRPMNGGQIEVSRGGSFVIGPTQEPRNKYGDDEKLIKQPEPRMVDPPRRYDRINGQTLTGMPPPPVIAAKYGDARRPNGSSDTNSSRSNGTNISQRNQDTPSNIEKPHRGIPAGTYIPGTDTSKGGYGPGVVGIPTVRNRDRNGAGRGEHENYPNQHRPSGPKDLPQPHLRDPKESRPVIARQEERTDSQSALIDYTAPGPDPKYTSGTNQVPNYSRLSASPQLASQRKARQRDMHAAQNTPMTPQSPQAQPQPPLQVYPRIGSHQPQQVQTYSHPPPLEPMQAYPQPPSSPQMRPPPPPQSRQFPAPPEQNLARAKQEILEQYVAASPEPQYFEPPVAQYAHVPPSPAGSDMSHLTSVSQREPAWTSPQQYIPPQPRLAAMPPQMMAMPPQMPMPMQVPMPMQIPIMQPPRQHDRSEIALETNPDFSVAGLPNRRRRNRPY